MKLLLDENLSPRLTKQIEDLFSGSIHVRTVGLGQRPDTEIWDFAKSHGFAIITADVDFYEMATRIGPPPKVIWMR